MAFMRVPSLEQEFGRDAAMGLNELGWGKVLLGRALGRDDEGRLVSRTSSLGLLHIGFYFSGVCHVLWGNFCADDLAFRC